MTEPEGPAPEGPAPFPTGARARIALEVACDDAEDAAVAIERGADRIELCAALEVGGVTPGPGLLAEARAAVRGELVVLARPRRGNFVYDARAFRALVRDVEAARELGADGVAVGVLTAAGELDEARLAVLVRVADPLTVTFHRAFDALHDPMAALARLGALGVRRVLTSGGGARAVDRRDHLAELAARAAAAGPDGAALEIVAAGGVRAEHVAALLARDGGAGRRTGLAAVHASASRLVPTGPAGRRSGGSVAAATAPSLGPSFGPSLAPSLAPSLLPAEDELRRVDPAEVTRLRAALDSACVAAQD